MYRLHMRAHNIAVRCGISQYAEAADLAHAINAVAGEGGNGELDREEQKAHDAKSGAYVWLFRGVRL
jgi:hypothetical protein